MRAGFSLGTPALQKHDCWVNWFLQTALRHECVPVCPSASEVKCQPNNDVSGLWQGANPLMHGENMEKNQRGGLNLSAARKNIVSVIKKCVFNHLHL